MERGASIEAADGTNGAACCTAVEHELPAEAVAADLNLLSMQVRPATDEERKRIVALLRANDLPASDLDASPVQLFVGVDGDEIRAVGGYEPYGTVGLLRSIAVPAENRSRGDGSAFCAQLEAQAAAAGIETLYLLTETATAFFRGRGYEQISREAVPETIRRTIQFRDLCPASATCLRRTLD